MAGTPNKATKEFRETVRLLEDTADNVGTWITQVAEGHGENKADPAKAFDLLAKLGSSPRRSWGAWSMSAGRWPCPE